MRFLRAGECCDRCHKKLLQENGAHFFQMSNINAVESNELSQRFASVKYRVKWRSAHTNGQFFLPPHIFTCQ